MVQQAQIANSILNPANFPSQAVVRSPFGLRQLTAGAPRAARGAVVYGPQRPIGPFTMGRGPLGPIPMGAVPTPTAGPGIPMPAGPNPVYGPGIPVGPVPPSTIVSEVPVTIRPPGINAGGGVGTVPYGPAVPASDLNAAGASPYGRIPSQVGSAGESAAASRGAGLLARLGYTPAGTTGALRFVRPGLTGLGAAGILGAGLTGGQLAGAGIGALNIGGKESAFDRFATGAAFGAPIGAAIGNVIPIPVVGAGIGALAGAGIGGVGNVVRGIFEDNDKAAMTRSNQKRANRIDSLFETAGLTPNQMAQYRAQFDTGMSILGDNPKPSDVAALLTQLETQVQKTAGTNTGKLTGKDMVALQAAIGQYMQPLIQQQQQSGQLAANMYNQMAGNMNNSALADQMRAQAANAQAQSDRMTAAYMGQAQSIPALYGLQQLGQLANRQQSTQSATLAEQLVANGAG